MIYPIDPLTQSVVVFSQNYLPISRVNVRRAVILLVTDKAEPMDWVWEQVPDSLSQTYWEVRSASLILEVPPYIRLKMQGIERVWKVPPVNRREVLRRDRYQCQYCSSRKKLTLDHVIPRSKGGKHTWDNVVIACETCNSRKGDRNPQEAGMHLKASPKAPCHPAIAFAEQFWRNQS